MNGFGLVQLVARLERLSLLHRLAADRAGAAARMLMRQAELVSDPGRELLLVAHPAVQRAVAPEWEAALAQRTGRTIRWQSDAGLALEGAFAQALQA
jgi:CubicO group peptidase (beta-lactamase class C family)